MAGINNQPGTYDPFLDKKEGETEKKIEWKELKTEQLLHFKK